MGTVMQSDKVILLVEDNRDDAELTLRALERSGIANKVVVATDGEEALDYLFGKGTYAARDTSLTPQVVLLDLNLPRLDGFAVLRRIRADSRTKLVPVIMLTSSREDEDIVNSYSFGANAYVRKPVDFTQFSEAVKTLGSFWLVMNEVAGPGGG
jgi:two-component system response regulator